MNVGWIKLHRKIIDNPIWNTGEPYDKVHAFIDLLLMANYEDKEIVAGVKTVVIRRGQVLTSKKKLAVKWGWSRDKVTRYICLLDNMGIATLDKTLSKTLNKTVLTIENYTKYQGEHTLDKTPSKTLNKATDKTPSNTLQKNIKNINNINNIYITPPLGDYENVLLTEEDLEALKKQFPYDWQHRINRLSGYIKTTGKRYRNHFETIVHWAEKEKNRQNKSGGSDKYSTNI